MDKSMYQILANSWNGLTNGNGHINSAFRNITISHIADEYVNAYTVVLRKIGFNEQQLVFFTDYRSPKVSQISSHNRLTVCGYNPATQIQLIFKGVATIHYRDEVAQHNWKVEGYKGQKSYLAKPAPSTAIEQPDDGLSYLASPQSNGDTPDGYENFAVVVIDVKQMEYLKLSPTGNRRAQFTLQPSGAWQGTWLIP
ncbi:pyridoxamine 5'-phosphate oxidase family protein [Mucilaginibacter lacusdianchii]|uniref:pyridoxamine 5'-phosphate oxidase family protein n=1 Tax=Mucilaginibacter lacusdianchii TaxID=2684211 RepID=UPI00131C57AD|nr:pyridoxamine 5'-phosphate oxidase family protein [Mucilaginibacter sp. JXJ CY 39]